MGQRLTFTFTILYMIAEDARLTPPRCKKHTAHDDTRLTPTCCKKHTASFARSTGNFPSHTIIRVTFVCLWACSLSTPGSFNGSSPNLVGVCRLTSHLLLRGSFSKRSMCRWVNGSLSLYTILYMRQPHATRCNGTFCFCKQQSLILRLLLHVLHLNNVCRCTLQMPLRGSFLKGQRVNGSNGSHLKVYVGGPRNGLEDFFFGKVNRSTAQQVKWVNRSMNQRVKRVNRSLSLSLYYIR